MSDSIKRALRTAAQAFLGVFAVALLGWAGEVATWAGCDAAASECVFPDPAPVVKAAVSGVAAAVAGLVAWAQNAIEDATGHALLKEPRQRNVIKAQA